MTDVNEFDTSLLKKKKKAKKVEDVDQVSDMMAELATKKKKKKPKAEDGGEDEGEDGVEDTADKADTPEPEAEAESFGFAKRKKKSTKASAATSEFDKALEAAGVQDSTEAQRSQDRRQALSTGVNEDGEPDLSYSELLSRFFEVLRENNPDLAGDRTGIKYKIPPPSVMREGNKKSLFTNIKEISDRMHRPTEHVIQFLFAELGTSGSVDGSNRLVIKGRFQQKQLETVLRRYIIEYVTCKTCKSVNTVLKKENRLYFLDCNTCGSRRSVSSIKTGYQAIMRRRKR